MRLRLGLGLGRLALDAERLPGNAGGGVYGLADIEKFFSETEAEGSVRPADYATVRFFNLQNMKKKLMVFGIGPKGVVGH